ncbi:hypothetical protein [Rhodococcus sp. 24CO]
MSRDRAVQYSVTIAEVDPEATGIAAPIFGDSGTVTAAPSVGS